MHMRPKIAGFLTTVLVLQGTFPALPVLADMAVTQRKTIVSTATKDNATGSDLEDDEWALENDLASPSVPENLLVTDLEIATLSSSTGDLWLNWNGDMDFPGDGTEDVPYQISNLSQLMGLSEAVASGISDFDGEYFELTQDIDLGGIDINAGNWNPIGWYQNISDLSGDVTQPFRGNFDGCGNTISGLKIVNMTYDLKNVGLFGVIDGGTVKNLTVEADMIAGFENAAVLAGALKGNAVIYNVTVTGIVHSEEDAGGIAAEVTGGTERVTIENCTAEGIVLNSEGRNSYTGGIAGNVQKAYLVDNTAVTQNGDSNRIQGKGYVGGIAGRMNLADIYNSYVDGTIGGNGSMAAGGIVGKYESGNLVLARMAGEISRTNQGTASREGTFVGTREARHNFTYGTEKSNHISYLFTNEAAKAKKVFGSNIDGDNSFTKSAHIGYWTDNEKKYVTVAISTETASGERYFYEELEDGVRYVVTKKLDKEFTSTGYFEGLDFRIDHFAPGYMGEPIKGYLVSVPRIDTRNANGTYDTDVATLTAMPSTNSSYYRTIDKDNAAAIAAGATVTVLTAPKNTNGNRYQMVTDPNEAGGVKAPTYIDEMGEPVATNYVNGGSYTFTMPECDTELNVEYIKVTTELTVSPSELTIQVTHTRSGDRKNPNITTEVHNAQGVLIARYIDGIQDTSVQVQPVTIHAEHNGAGEAADRTVLWSVDDTDLIINSSDANYTVRDAMIMPNLNSSFVQNIINREVKAQAENQYQEAINNTIYSKVAVVTAATNPDTSVNNQPVYGNSKVTVTFQIVDNTTLRVEGLNLNKSSIAYTVTRRLTGDRRNPVESYTCTEPSVLTATLSPEQPFYKNVSWKDKEAGKIITLTPGGTYSQDCTVKVNFGPQGKDCPAWMQNIINEDNNRKAADPYVKLDGSGSYLETVTATSEDQTHGQVSAVCDIMIEFRTVDETVIHPEQVEMSKDAVEFNLVAVKAGDAQSDTVSMTGFEPVDLDCTVIPDLPEDENHKPYDRDVIWSVSDSEILSVTQDGLITPNPDAQWIKDASMKTPYTASRTATVYAATKDGRKTGSTMVTLNYQTKCLELSEDEVTIHLILKKTGRRNNPTLTWEGGDSRALVATTYQESRQVKYKSSNPSALQIQDDGTITPVLDENLEWMKPAMNYPYTAAFVVTVSAEDGTSKDECIVRLNIEVKDMTTSGGSSGGGGGGGGGGSSKGVTTTGATIANDPALPEYAVTGTWMQNAAGRWMFTDGKRTYANEWAAIHNPYANVAAGQSAFDWFRFDAEGFMVTGWYTDTDGRRYYLHETSDGTLGRMVTGWNWIGGNCYYFQEISDGTLGALKRNFTAPDGKQTNQDGIWVMDGIVQTQK